MPGVEIWNLIQEWDHVIAAVSTSIAALILVYKKGLKPVLKHFQNWYDMSEKIDHIFSEITPNGGTSIKDTVTKIDKGLTLVSERQRALVADSEAALFETDSDGSCIWTNRTYTRLVQRDSSEVLGHGWQNTIAEEDRTDFVTAWYTAVKEDREFSMKFNFETPTGTKIPCRVRSYKMTNPQGEVVGYLGSCKVL